MKQAPAMASPTQPARANPSAIATWVELGPGRRLHAPTRSRKCSRLIQARCSTASRSIRAMCAAGPPNAVSPRRMKKRNNSPSLPAGVACILVLSRSGLAASTHAGINGDGQQAEQHGKVGARFVQKTQHTGVAYVLRHGERSQRPSEQDGDLGGDDSGEDDRKQAKGSLARVEIRKHGGPSSNFNRANQRSEYLRSHEADMGEAACSQLSWPDELEDPFADKDHCNDDADQDYGKASAHIASVPPVRTRNPHRGFQLFKRVSIRAARSPGLVAGAKRPTTLPLLSTRNFVKFHLIRCVPSRPRLL